MRDFISLFRRRKNLPGRIVNAARKRRAQSSGKPVVGDGFSYSSRTEYYRFMRNRVPIISSAIWNWVRLCNTSGGFHLHGSDSQRREAEEFIHELSGRISTVCGLHRHGLGALIERFFLELFTNGNYSGRIIPLPSGKGIDFFEELEQEQLHWQKNGRWKPFIKIDDTISPIEQQNFFHYGLGADQSNPMGVSFLSSVEFVTGIEQRMLDDMALSSHNVGNPHLHIRITPPEKFEHEPDAAYLKRAEKYFDDTVSNFDAINADDNLFSWSDLEVTVVGGDRAMSQSWRVNREQVIEDVITGMKLFPWVVGRSHGTTKNWVQAQYNLLMQVVDSIQEEGKAFAEWILNSELEMRNIPVRAEYFFNPNQDPYQHEKEKAAALKFDTVDKKVARGYISKEQGAKELGYSDVFQSE